MTEPNDLEDKLDEAIKGVEKIQKEKTSAKRLRFYVEFAKTQDITKWKRPVYVIHEHETFGGRLHWDLRFEDDGKMETWRIYKSPPWRGQKLAHKKSESIPIGAALFEGEIRQEYGAGKLKIWDSGTFEIVEKNETKFVVNIKGKELNGKYSLVSVPNDVPRLDKWFFKPYL